MTKLNKATSHLQVNGPFQRERFCWGAYVFVPELIHSTRPTGWWSVWWYDRHDGTTAHVTRSGTNCNTSFICLLSTQSVCNQHSPENINLCKIITLPSFYQEPPHPGHNSILFRFTTVFYDNVSIYGRYWVNRNTKNVKTVLVVLERSVLLTCCSRTNLFSVFILHLAYLCIIQLSIILPYTGQSRSRKKYIFQYSYKKILYL